VLVAVMAGLSLHRPVVIAAGAMPDRAREYLAAVACVLNDLWPPALVPRRPQHVTPEEVLALGVGEVAATELVADDPGEAVMPAGAIFARPPVARAQQGPTGSGATPEAVWPATPATGSAQLRYQFMALGRYAHPRRCPAQRA
jgi:hypothetical protein